MKRLLPIFVMLILCSIGCGLFGGDTETVNTEGLKLNDFNTETMSLKEKKALLNETKQIVNKTEKEAKNEQIATNIIPEEHTTLNTDSEDEEVSNILKKLNKKKEKTLVENEKLAQTYYENALVYYRQLEYDKAKEFIKKCLKLNPSHQDAKVLEQNIKYDLGEYKTGNTEVIINELANRAKAEKERQAIEIRYHLDKGVVYFDTEEYDKSISEMKTVLKMVNNLPEDVDTILFEGQAKSYIEKAKQRRVEKEIELKKKMEANIKNEEENKEKKLIADKREKIELLFKKAQKRFEEDNYDDTIRLCKAVLELDPNFKLAEELKDFSTEVKQGKIEQWLLAEYKRRWKDLLFNIDMKSIAQNNIVQFTTLDIWKNRISKRKTLQLSMEKESMSDADRDVLNKLEVLKISINFNDQVPLSYFIDMLSSNSDVNFVFDVNKMPDAPENIYVPPIRMNESPIIDILDFALDLVGLAYKASNGVIIITSKTEVVSEMVVRIYDISDLITKIVDFKPPNLILNSADNADEEEEEPEEPTSPITGDKMMELITQNVAKETWSDEGGPGQIYAIRGMLVINQTPDIHNEILVFLNGIREATGILVTIDAKFLNVRTTFLDELGVDWRGLNADTGAGGAISPDGTGIAPLLPWAVPTSNESGGVPFTFDAAGGTAPSAGFSAPTTYENLPIAGRVENIVSNDTLISNFYSSVLANTGGTTLDYTMLDDVSSELILRAVKKDANSRILISPKLTLFNGQRGHILAGEQIVYVQDYNIEIAAGSAAPDPVLGVFQTGTSLDVRPVVSADKKYITMEMAPTSVEQIGNVRQNVFNIRLFYYNVDAGFDIAANLTVVNIELPQLRIQNLRTTVTIPDGGTLILGGMAGIESVNYEASSPLLGDLPLFGWLFSRQIEGKERRSIIIMAKGKITIMEEEENLRFGDMLD